MKRALLAVIHVSFAVLASSTLLFPAAGVTAKGAAASWPVSLVDVARQAGLVHGRYLVQTGYNDCPGPIQQERS